MLISDCTGHLLTVPQLCEDRSRPACCYTIVSDACASLMETSHNKCRSAGTQEDLHLARYLPECGGYLGEMSRVMLIAETIVSWLEGFCLNKFWVIMSWVDITNAYQDAILDAILVIVATWLGHAQIPGSIVDPSDKEPQAWYISNVDTFIKTIKSEWEHIRIVMAKEIQ